MSDDDGLIKFVLETHHHLVEIMLFNVFQKKSLLFYFCGKVMTLFVTMHKNGDDQRSAVGDYE